MKNTCALALSTLLVLGALSSGHLSADVAPHGGMLRTPDVSATHIVFVYANDLWIVERDGGTALPLASPPGVEGFPRFNDAGTVIAFMGNYDGNQDLYTIPAAGGTPFRVTHHPGGEWLSGWTPDNDLIYFAYATKDYPRAAELFTVSPDGGLPQEMPVPYGALGAVSGDGQWLAYTPHTRDQRTWKRYRGGMATDIWLFHLTDHTSKKMTDWEGTDSQPMWHGDSVYYLSDGGPNHRLNIWRYDVASGQRSQITDYADYDVKWPAIGPGANGGGEIVYQQGANLRLLDLATGASRTVEVTIPGDRPKLRQRQISVAEQVFSGDISPSGARASLGARGDIWTAPAENGSPRNLTRTSGIAERDPSWSPDGRWLAYFSDETGEYQLYVRGADGKGTARKLTDENRGFLYNPTWSPDSEWVVISDKAGRVTLHSVDSGEIHEITVMSNASQPFVSWSSDSNWLAWTESENLLEQSAIWLYDVSKHAKHQVTAGMFADTWPTFDREGDYLYFASLREFSEPIYESLGTTWVYAQADRLYAVPLRDDVDSPLLPESDEEEVEEEEDGDEEDKKGKKDKKNKKDADEGEDEEEDDTPKPVKIDLDGFERRAIELPVDRGSFTRLAVNHEGKLLYLRSPLTDGDRTIHLLDLDDEDDEYEKMVASSADAFSISANGEKIIVAHGEQISIVDAAPDQDLSSAIDTSGMMVEYDARAEWKQLFHETWRIQRDFFYDPSMHGVDWDGVREQYAAMLDDVNSREDLSYVLREMISELNVGHAYYFGGDNENEPNVPVGMLGADYELIDGAYKIAKIYEGAAWDTDARGPLSQPGIDVDEGDYLLAVNGVPVDTSKDPWASFRGLAGRTVTLTVSDKSTWDDDAREVIVEPMRSERSLRYRAWIEKNRAYVSEQTDGKVGYIYVPNTGIEGQDELVRQYYGQLNREALIVDERWNGGGQIPTRFVELLNRPIANYWAVRDGEDWPWPPDAHQGPKCMLINGLAGSGGDYFPWWFREAGLGKLIGTRTWGGLVGISGNPQLIDGGYTSAPTFAFYEKDGTWGIEGHGVDPDIEVIDDPALMVDGGDPQLDAAIAHMLEEIGANPYTKPERPAYPDRSGMGIEPSDI